MLRKTVVLFSSFRAKNVDPGPPSPLVCLRIACGNTKTANEPTLDVEPLPMKATKLKTAAVLAVSAGIASSGLSLGQATSNVVGYETNDLVVGFNYTGQRLVGSQILATTVSGAPAGTTVTLAADSGLSSERVVFEVNSGTAAGTVVVAVVTGTTAVTSDDLSAELADGDSVVLREAATLASVFGDPLTAPLVGGSTAAGSDIVLVPNGSGGFDQYYYKGAGFGTFGWYDAVTDIIVPNSSAVDLVYTDGIVINVKTTPTAITYTGDVKTDDTSFAILSGFNYISTIYPAGSTLATAFGDPINAPLVGGSTAAGSDIILVPDGAGGFTQYYYLGAGFGTFEWKNAVTEASVDPTTVSLSSGVVINRKTGSVNLTVAPPAFYSSL